LAGCETCFGKEGVGCAQPTPHNKRLKAKRRFLINTARQTVRIHIAGRGGEGNITLGETLAKCYARRGYHVFSFRTYPAEIEGGVAQIVLQVGVQKVRSLGTGSELACVLTQDAMEEVRGELGSECFVIHDQVVRGTAPFRSHAIEATKTARWTFGNPKLKNLIALGTLGKVLGFEEAELIQAAHERTSKVDVELIAKTVAHGMTLAPEGENFSLAQAQDEPQMILSGNQAIGFGAVRAGCDYVAGYPITPASPLLEYLAKTIPAFGGTVVQAEDEMAAIGSCLGASYAGRKSLTPTSGPGFALMSEMINLGVMTELPLVIVNVQRAGPSTGMPSKTEQGDLLYAMFGSPGESPRIVLAASDVQDAYHQTIRAFNLAETLQCPVIVLSDQSLAYRQETVPSSFGREAITLTSRERVNGTPPEEFKRYLQTASGSSAMPVPDGHDAPYIATGLEHDEDGQENYSADVHRRMTEKRFRKLDHAAMLAAAEEQDFEKPDGAKIGVMGWGSTRGTIVETVERLNADGKSLARIHLHTLRPLPEKHIREFCAHLDKLIIVEENFSGQLAMLIRGIVDCDVVSVTKCEGIPFEVQELVEKLKS
jgi:2-oxoglutarate ferredoxin oxidoreductase subunit alpha